MTGLEDTRLLYIYGGVCMNKSQEEKELKLVSVSRIIKTYKKYWWILLVLVLAAGICAAGYQGYLKIGRASCRERV